MSAAPNSGANRLTIGTLKARAMMEPAPSTAQRFRRRKARAARAPMRRKATSSKYSRPMR